MKQSLIPGPDPFDVYRIVQRQNTGLRIALGGAVFICLVLVALVCLLALERKTVLIADMNGGPTHVLKAGHQDRVTEAYARSFFVRMLNKRFGWSSPTVLTDMEDYLRSCYKTLREREEAGLTALVTVRDKDGEAQRTRRESYVRALVRNDVVLPGNMAQVKCGQIENHTWLCDTSIEVITQSLVPPYSTHQRETLRLRASLGEVPFSLHSLDGLILLDLEDIMPKKGET